MGPEIFPVSQRLTYKTQSPTKLAESPFVIGAFDPPFLRMGVQTLVACRTIAVLGVPPAFWHSPQVVLMQELALVAFLTQPTQPVLADR